MRKRLPSFCVVLVICSLAASLRADDVPVTAKSAPRDNEGWLKRSDQISQRAKEGNVDLLFLGDSITQGWNNNEVWKKHYGKRNAMNAGIGGDRTQHVLWRIENGNVDGIKPKLAVLMIGTNNAGSDTSQDIAAGVKAIVGKLREKLPETKVLVLAIFPRGDKPDNPARKVNAGANEIIKSLADDQQVFYLDIGPKFVAEDGTISKEIMPDYLHLSPKGYAIWAEAIEPTVAKLLGEQ